MYKIALRSKKDCQHHAKNLFTRTAQSRQYLSWIRLYLLPEWHHIWLYQSKYTHLISNDIWRDLGRFLDQPGRPTRRQATKSECSNLTCPPQSHIELGKSSLQRNHRRNSKLHWNISTAGLNEKCTGCNMPGNLRSHISQHHRMLVHNMQLQRKIYYLKMYRQNVMKPQWFKQAKQSRYCMCSNVSLGFDIGTISLSTDVWSGRL